MMSFEICGAVMIITTVAFLCYHTYTFYQMLYRYEICSFSVIIVCSLFMLYDMIVNYYKRIKARRNIAFGEDTIIRKVI
jgi:hypothetical protein